MLRIAVCIKSVLNGAQEGAERNEKSTGMNPADLYALETALTADLGKREVSVFSMGPQATAGTLLMDAARLGADRLFLLADRAFAGSDTFATAKILRRALEVTGPYDLILCGERAIDGETGQVPGELSAMLGLPFLPCGIRLELKDDVLRCRSLQEDGTQTLEAGLPAVVSISCGMTGITHPLMPSLRSLRKAREIGLTVLDSRALGFRPEEIGQSGSLTRVQKTFSPTLTRTCRFVHDAVEGAALTAACCHGIKKTP